MATNTRIIYLNTVNLVETEDWLMFDRPSSSTYKINSGIAMQQVTEDTMSYYYSVISKTDDSNFVVTSSAYNKLGGSPVLYNGYYTFFSTDSTLENDFQPVANPNINVDGTGSKPLYNGHYFDYFGYNDEKTISALDSYTIAIGNEYMLVYNLDNDCWLIYKLTKASGEIETRITNKNFPSSANGWFNLGLLPLYSEFTINSSVFPISSIILGSKTPVLDSASFAVAPLGEASFDVLDGVVEKPNENVSVSLNGEIMVTGMNTNINADTASGIVSITHTQTTIHGKVESNRSIRQIYIDLSLNIDDVPQGDETLTRRYGVYWFWVI